MNHGGDIYRNRIQMDFSVNLNPFQAPQAISDAISRGIIRAGEYPDQRQERIREKIAGYEGISADCVYAGNGASELIFAATKAIMPRKALLIEPGFAGYRHALNSLHNTEISIGFLVKENGFALTEDILDKIDRSVDVVFLADPWNPTGQNIDNGLLISIIEKAAQNNAYIILDQSFIFMSDGLSRTFETSGLVNRFENLIVIRSMTKILGLPGIRMGYVLANNSIISRIRSQLPEWNLSVISEEVMMEGLKLIHEDGFCKESVQEIAEGRAYLTRELESLGCKTYRSDTAFILTESEYDLYNELLERGVLIRSCEAIPGLGKGFFRIAVKNAGENRILINKIKEIINGH